MSRYCTQCRQRGVRCEAVVAVEANLPVEHGDIPRGVLELACLWHWSAWETSGFACTATALSIPESQS